MSADNYTPAIGVMIVLFTSLSLYGIGYGLLSFLRVL